MKMDNSKKICNQCARSQYLYHLPKGIWCWNCKEFVDVCRDPHCDCRVNEAK